MAKRFTDTEIWKKQRWFRKLSPINKLAFFYIKDQCNHAGIWKIDCSDLIDDLGLEDFNLDEFINEMNLDFDKINGSKKHKERVKIIKDNNLWITGFMQFQYESKEKLVSINSCVRTAILILTGLDIYSEALDKGYITLKEKQITDNDGYVTNKDKDNNIINNKINKESEILNSNGTWEDEKKYFLSDEQYQMGIFTTYRLKKEQLDLYLKDFINMLELNQDYKSCKELRRHFTNWVKKKEESKLPKQYNQVDHTKYKINLK
jgi:hypothetical protein